jgi:hypothetical protein
VSEERIMPRMLDYQKEIVENTSSPTIIGNMSRGGGKDYILACKVLYERPKVSYYISWYGKQFTTLQEKFKEIFNMSKEIENKIKYFNTDKDKIKIEFNNGDISEIYNYNTLLKQGNILLNSTVDMVLYSNCLPQFDIKSKKHIAMLSISYSWLKNVYPCRDIEIYNISLQKLIENNLMTKEWLEKYKKNDSKVGFRQEFDLFGEYDEIFSNKETDVNNIKFDTGNFYDNQIEELMIEYSETPKNRNTTLTRENILQQIHILQEMKRDNKLI